MDSGYMDYLAVLDGLSKHLERLAELARNKTEAVRRDDLMALDHVLNQEQAMALAIRGLEQKRLKLLTQLGWDDKTLRELPDHYPDALRLQAKQAVEELRRDYQLYQGAAEAARHTLECNLHEIEKVLTDSGKRPEPGDSQRLAGPPPAMKTDIRA